MIGDLFCIVLVVITSVLWKLWRHERHRRQQSEELSSRRFLVLVDVMRERDDARRETVKR